MCIRDSIYLIAIELNAVLCYLKIVLDFREEQNAGKSERIIHIEVNPEQGIILTGVQFMIE